VIVLLDPAAGKHQSAGGKFNCLMPLHDEDLDAVWLSRSNKTVAAGLAVDGQLIGSSCPRRDERYTDSPWCRNRDRSTAAGILLI
jgi:hypothetical protein